MPGPVSDSYPGPKDPPRRGSKAWKTEVGAMMKRNGFKYLVLKWDDLMDALTPLQLRQLDDILIRNQRVREKCGKTTGNEYWICNRADPWADAVRMAMEAGCGHKIGPGTL